eukprot:902275_1
MSADSLDEFIIVTDNIIDQMMPDAEYFIRFVSYWIATLNISPIFLQTNISSVIIEIFNYVNTNWNITTQTDHISYFAETLNNFYTTICRPIPQQQMDQSLLNSIETTVHQIINWYGYYNMFSYKLVAYGSQLHK